MFDRFWIDFRSMLVSLVTWGSLWKQFGIILELLSAYEGAFGAKSKSASHSAPTIAFDVE